MAEDTTVAFKKKLLLGIAIACGALALVMLYAYLNAQKEQGVKDLEAMKQQMQSQVAPPRQESGVAVLVAAREIKQGAVISSSDIAAREIPRSYLTPGALPANVNIIGLTALAPLSPGEQILQAKVGQPEKPKLLAAITPPGRRAVPVTVDNSFAGLLQPGDYVDVLALINPPPDSPLYALAVSSHGTKDAKGGETKKLVTVPLFQNILVLTLGGGQEQGKYPPSGPTQTITLSLSPQEAALVAFVQEQGKIKLVMRSNSDTSDTAVQAVNWDSLFEYLYPESRENSSRKPATVEIYRGLHKETVALPIEGQK